MKPEINSTFTLMVGGADFEQHDLECLYKNAHALVAVDGGANNLPHDTQPNFIVGDMDSINQDLDWSDQVVFEHVSDQDTTDFEKAISFCLSRNLPQPFVCLGFTGGRFDQTLTILHACCRFPLVRFVFVAEQDLISTLPLGRSKFEFEVGERLSLYPLTPCQFGPSTGLKYALDGLNMEQGHTIGTSNQVVKQQVEIELRQGVCFLMTEANRPLSNLHNLA